MHIVVVCVRVGCHRETPFQMGSMFRAGNLICLSEGHAEYFGKHGESKKSERMEAGSKCVSMNAATYLVSCHLLNVPNLLSFGQVDPQLPPGGEFLSVTEVVCHFLASIPGHQRRAVLVEFV